MRVGDVSYTDSKTPNVQSHMGVNVLKKTQKINKEMAKQLIDSVPKMKANKVDTRV
jgi:hypothetical protein